MLLAEHPGLRSIGVLAIIGLGSTLVATLLFFPALLYLLRIGPTR
jgi:predicted RND superfamily exporter protein